MTSERRAMYGQLSLFLALLFEIAATGLGLLTARPLVLRGSAGDGGAGARSRPAPPISPNPSPRRTVLAISSVPRQ
ncbi:hypothetical protein [Streptomyces sp. NPDC001970]